MYKFIERPLSEQERARLLAWTPAPPPPFRGLETRLVAHGVVCAILIPLLFLGIRDLRWNHSAGPFVVLSILLIYLLIQLKKLVFTPLRIHRQRNQAVLSFRQAVTRASAVLVQQIESNEVVEIFHDEGCIYLFATGDSRSYWIDPQRPGKNWPNTKFEIVRVPGLGEDLGPFCHGQFLKPRKQLEFRDYFEEFDFDTLPADGVIACSVDSFLETARTKTRN